MPRSSYSTTPRPAPLGGVDLGVDGGADALPPAPPFNPTLTQVRSTRSVKSSEPAVTGAPAGAVRSRAMRRERRSISAFLLP